MSKKIKWGILGLGGIAHDFARQFKSENAELVAVGSRSIEKANGFAKQYAISKAYGNYEDLCADEEIDIVYLATPNNYHAEHMKLILSANKHVLAEKAITMNKAELDEVLEIAQSKGLIVAEAMTIYHMPLYQIIKDRIHSGEFGKLKLATAYFGSVKEPDSNNRFFSPALGGGALLDIGVYALSFVHYFLEAEIGEIQTVVKPFHTGVDEMASISYTTTEGTIGNTIFSFRSKLPKQGIVSCEEAFITFNGYPSASEAVITYLDDRTEVVRAGNSSERLRYEMENITQMLLTGADSSFIHLTKDVTYIMDAAIKQWKLEAINDQQN